MNSIAYLLSPALLLILGGCSNINNPSAPAVAEIPVENRAITIQDTVPSSIIELKDGDTFDMQIDEVKQEIDGKTQTMLAYNGSIPGPTLKVPQGAEITINLKNNTEIPNSLHSHGVRLENQYDGVVDMLQKPIGLGETFTYKIKFPDAGMFWYHPHLNEVFTQSRGLYGNYWVVPQDKTYWGPVNEEIPLMLNDLSIVGGELSEYRKVSNYALMGKFGNTMLVNGVPNFQREFKQGEIVRFYITNAANTRTFRLAIPQAKIKLVGGDNGKYEEETWQESVILSPSERVILEIFFEKPGIYLLQNTHPEKTYNLATFKVSDQKVEQSFAESYLKLQKQDDLIKELDQIRPFFDKKPDKKIRFDLQMSMGQMGGNQMMMQQDDMVDHSAMGHQMMGGDGLGKEIEENLPVNSADLDKIEWEDSMVMMNAMSYSDSTKWKIVDEETGLENMDINWQFKQGDLVKIEVFNDDKSVHPMQHPLHFHGQRFLVLSNNGERNENLVWKDTALIPKGDRVELLVEMSNPGQWMAHCHIAEHLESGMMLQFEVK